MQRKTITDAELDIMKVLWEHGTLSSADIFAKVNDEQNKNKGTLKTFLTRLVQKGAVKRDKINERQYVYTHVVSKQEYLKKHLQRLIDQLCDGSAQKLIEIIKRDF